MTPVPSGVLVSSVGACFGWQRHIPLLRRRNRAGRQCRGSVGTYKDGYQERDSETEEHGGEDAVFHIH